MYSKEGYRRNSPDKNNPYNIIPSGTISMKNVDHPVLGIDEYGNMQWMMPGEDYQFPGNTVLEIPYMQQGGIHINPANKGKFTAQANRANMGVQEYANYVLRNKENFSSTTVKRANFARNANKWKKQEGGEMNEEIIKKIQEALQQGITPEQLVKELQKQGITEQEAIQLVSAAMPQQEEMQQYQYGTTVRHNYADNINFDTNFKKAGEDWNKVGQSFKNWNNSEWGDESNNFDWKTVRNALDSTFTKGNINATALGLNAVSDPRNMTWALPDTGFGSGLKAISGLASGLAGSYLGYAKLFSDDKVTNNTPTATIGKNPNAQIQAPYVGTDSEKALPTDWGKGYDLPKELNPYDGNTNIQGTNQYSNIQGTNQYSNIHYTNLLKKADPVEEQEKKEWFSQNPGKSWFDYLKEKNKLWTGPAYSDPNANVFDINNYEQFQKGGMKKYQWAGTYYDNPINRKTTAGLPIINNILPSENIDFNIDSLVPKTDPNLTIKSESWSNIQNPWLSQYSDNTNPNPPRIYTKDTVPNKIDRLTYQHYFPDATIDEGNIAMNNYQNKDINVNSNNQNNDLEITNNKLKSNSTITSMNDDALGFMIANNALIGFQNFNDVLSARDRKKEYNQMLMKTGNSDQRYNPINPTNPYGMYTPNAGIGPNYGLVANSHIQDFGTSMASAKCGGMKKKYQEAGKVIESRSPSYMTTGVSLNQNTEKKEKAPIVVTSIRGYQTSNPNSKAPSFNEYYNNPNIKNLAVYDYVNDNPQGQTKYLVQYDKSSVPVTTKTPGYVYMYASEPNDSMFFENNPDKYYKDIYGRINGNPVYGINATGYEQEYIEELKKIMGTMSSDYDNYKQTTQKTGGIVKKYKEGGEYNLTQEEIDYILKNGGEIEMLD